MPRVLLKPAGTGCRMLVRLTPKSSRDTIEGIDTDADGRPHLKARVRAIPEKGEANAALVKLLAKSLGVPASAVVIGTGATSRLKTVHVEATPGEIAVRLAKVID